MKETTRRILFVDDSAYVLEALERMLADIDDDWEIEYANSGDRALALIARRPFDVVATDLQMPGMNGDVLIERIRASGAATRCIVLCGDPAIPEAAAMARQGYPIIEKPCDGRQLQAVIKAEIHRIGKARGESEVTQ